MKKTTSKSTLKSKKIDENLAIKEEKKKSLKVTLTVVLVLVIFSLILVILGFTVINPGYPENLPS